MAEAKATVLAGEWLSTEETMRELGKARRTIQEIAQRGELQWTMASRGNGMRPERLYNAADVKKLKAEAQKMALVRREPRERVPAAMQALQLVAAVREVAQASLPAIPLKEKLWLSLEEAEAYSGIAEPSLRELLEDGQLKALRIGPYRTLRILRKSLEAFEG